MSKKVDSKALQEAIELIMDYMKSDFKKTIIEDTQSNYSTHEHIVGKWINDKPLYEKTIVILGIKETAQIAHNINDIDIAFIVSEMSINKNNIRVSNNCNITIDNTNINIESTNYDGDFTSYVTIRYTKTID